MSAGQTRAQPMARYMEPNEQAYTIEVPSTWVVRGGIQRRSITQPHSVVTLQSPGGQTFIMLGNPAAISYSTPTQMGFAMGFREGSLYAPNGDPMLIRSYATGQQFAITTGRDLLQQGGCDDVHVVRTRGFPSTSTGIAGVPQTSTGGEAVFHCSRRGVAYDAYMFALTRLTGLPQSAVGAIWDADSSYFLVTPAGELDEAGALLSRVIGSVRMNQQWVAQQIRAAGASAAATADRPDRALAEQAQSLRQSFGEAEADRAASQEEMDRLISGFDTYRDPAGNLHTVPYASGNTGWYSNGLGRVAGTRTGEAPGPGWVPMTRIPP